MKSHPLAPVFAMALLLAILMWLCSSCEKRTTWEVGRVDSLDAGPYVMGDTSECDFIVFPDCGPYKVIQWNDGKSKPNAFGNYLVFMRRCAVDPDDPEKREVCQEHHEILTWMSLEEGWNTKPWESPYNPLDYKVTVLYWMILPPTK